MINHLLLSAAIAYIVYGVTSDWWLTFVFGFSWLIGPLFPFGGKE